MKRLCALMTALGVGAGLAGCGGGESPVADRSVPAAPGIATTTTAITAEPATTATAPEPAAPPAISGPSTEPVVVKAVNTDVALLADVRVARQPGFDRVVFEFRGDDTPGYDVRYVKRPITADGSGSNIEIAGSNVIQVRMENALDADLEKQSAPATYTGPTRLTPRLPAVEELARSGGYEGVLTWVIGTRSRVGYVVSTLQDPPRLVIDVATG